MPSTVITHAFGRGEEMEVSGFEHRFFAAVVQPHCQGIEHQFACVLVCEVVTPAVITAQNDSAPLFIGCRCKNLLLARYMVGAAERRKQNHPAFATIHKIGIARMRPWRPNEKEQKQANEYAL